MRRLSWRRSGPVAVIIVGLVAAVGVQVAAVTFTPPPLGQDPRPGARCVFEQPGFRPDPGCSPGELIQPVISKKTFCEVGYSDRVRNVPQKLKNEVLADYGLSEPEFKGHIDHVAALALGGTNGKKNLAPIPASGEWGNQNKKAVETRVRRQVCGPGGTWTVEQAQAKFVTVVVNWREADDELPGGLP